MQKLFALGLHAVLGIVEQGVFADLFEGLLAEDMLGLAGVLGGDGLVHAELDEEMGQQRSAMARPGSSRVRLPSPSTAI